jgi:hypothetical protein
MPWRRAYSGVAFVGGLVTVHDHGIGAERDTWTRNCDAGPGAVPGQPTGDAGDAAAIPGDTRTTPANSLPRASGTTSTFSPGCGAWIIQPLPR